MSKSPLRAGAPSTAAADPAIAAIAPHREAWEAAGEASSLADRATGRAARTAESAKRRADRAEAKAFQRLIERARQTRVGARAALAYLIERMRTSLGLAFGAEAPAALLAALARSRALED
jgi:hypothetical protein